MTPRCFKCSQFRKGTLDFNFECTKLLRIDFRKQQYITTKATIHGQDRIYPKTHLCRTFLLSIYKSGRKGVFVTRTCFRDANAKASLENFEQTSEELTVFKNVKIAGYDQINDLVF